ncbi:MAG: SdpI family protein [Lachnospiraceae bacterium]
MEKIQIMALIDLLIPVIILIFGLLMALRPPRTINIIYGYRTERSMKNQDTWEFANRLCGKIWIGCGIVLGLITVLALFIGQGLGDTFLGMLSIALVTIQMIAIFLTLIPVERTLKREFDQDGARRM